MFYVCFLNFGVRSYINLAVIS